jgi:hypothetical protein
MFGKKEDEAIKELQEVYVEFCTAFRELMVMRERMAEIGSEMTLLHLLRSHLSMAESLQKVKQQDVLRNAWDSQWVRQLSSEDSIRGTRKQLTDISNSMCYHLSKMHISPQEITPASIQLLHTSQSEKLDRLRSASQKLNICVQKVNAYGISIMSRGGTSLHSGNTGLSASTGYAKYGIRERSIQQVGGQEASYTTPTAQVYHDVESLATGQGVANRMEMVIENQSDVLAIGSNVSSSLSVEFKKRSDFKEVRHKQKKYTRRIGRYVSNGPI